MEAFSFDTLPIEVAKLHYKIDRLESILLNKLEDETTRPPATRRQAAEFLNISLPTLGTLISTGQLKAFKIGRQVRIDWAVLEAFIKYEGGNDGDSKA